MNEPDKTTATGAASQRTGAGCRVVRAGAAYEGKQGLSYSAGISAESAGTRGLCLHSLVTPSGGRAHAHLHAQHESAICMVSGESEVWSGAGLPHRDVLQAGDFILIPAGVPHLLEVCRALRDLHPGLPIVMLSALGNEGDRVAGLEFGADDYVTKPFSARELVLRVAAVLRRATAAAAPTVPLVDGDLVVDLGARTARRGDEALPLTGREFDLLAFLLAHPGRAYNRAELLAEVWGWEFGDQSTVTVHVRRLREKIESDPTRPRRIATVWGTGYRYDPWVPEMVPEMIRR